MATLRLSREENSRTVILRIQRTFDRWAELHVQRSLAEAPGRAAASAPPADPEPADVDATSAASTPHRTYGPEEEPPAL